MSLPLPSLPQKRSPATEAGPGVGLERREKKKEIGDPLRLSRSRSPSSQFSALEEGVSSRPLLWELGAKEAESCVFRFFSPSKPPAAAYSRQILRASLGVSSRVPSCTL